MNNTSRVPPPPPPQPQTLWQKVKPWLIGIVIACVVGLLIFLLVKRKKQCKKLEDEANKTGKGKLKCKSAQDTGPVNECGKWMCLKPCPLLYIEDPLSGGCRKAVAGPKDSNIPIPHDRYEATE